jgi:hypothetical protein
MAGQVRKIANAARDVITIVKTNATDWNRKQRKHHEKHHDNRDTALPAPQRLHQARHEPAERAVAHHEYEVALARLGRDQPDELRDVA